MGFSNRPGAVRTLLVVAVAIAALIAAGCGETVIDDVKTEGAIEENVERTLRVKVSSVDCPADVEVTTGTTFKCTVVMAGGERQTASLKVLNDDADVEFLDLSPKK